MPKIGYLDIDFEDDAEDPLAELELLDTDTA